MLQCKGFACFGGLTLRDKVRLRHCICNAMYCGCIAARESYSRLFSTLKYSEERKALCCERMDVSLAILWLVSGDISPQRSANTRISCLRSAQCVRIALGSNAISTFSQRLGGPRILSPVFLCILHTSRRRAETASRAKKVVKCCSAKT